MNPASRAAQVPLPPHSSDWLRAALGLDASHQPFPWQLELLRLFGAGVVPSSLDIPTGLGKTAVMAVWLIARALGAPLPRRLVYVVDRRAVVDQATAVAEALRSWVDKEPAVAEALGLGRKGLPISTLRGQHVDNRAWLEDPSSPAIVVGTVDMVGSRLLFSGYGVSSKMRPYHAGLLGADALVVLDEAHLVPPFESLVRSVATDAALGPRGDARARVPATHLLSLSATGRVDASAFRLTEADHAHPVVTQRLDARKYVRMAPPVESSTVAEALATRAWALSAEGTQPCRVLVFTESRATAQAVVDELRRQAAKRTIHLELIVGGRRVAERARAATRLTELGLVAGSSARPTDPVFVVATSAGEVGIDLDADHAVLDLVEWERMVQRLGRVNRRGEGEAEVWVVPTLPDKKLAELLEKEARSADQARSSADASQGDDEEQEPNFNADDRERLARHRRRQATLTALQALPTTDHARLGSPRALGALKVEHEGLAREASTPAPAHPALGRAVAEAWSMTSLDEHTGRPGVQPWLRGWVDDEPQTTLVWRTWLPEPKNATEFFDAAPPELVETLEVETMVAHDWLLKRIKLVAKARTEARRKEPSKEAEGAAHAELAAVREWRPDDVALFVLGERPRGWRLSELEGLDKRRRDDFLRELYGATIVVDVRLGGLDSNGLLDAKEDGATDASEVAHLPFRVRWVEGADLDVNEGWRTEATFVASTNDDGEATAWLVIDSDEREPATTADGRSTGREQRLDEHQAFAERHARIIGEGVGLDRPGVELLALAAALHDEGKKADRWQRAFRAPSHKRPLGKTTSRPLQSILAGYRHELGSLPYAERDPRVTALSPDDRDLVLHLIAAHHGFARPLLRTDGYDEAPPSALVELAQTIALRFARLERRWGPWGLAWWEALLRAADQGASRENDERGGSDG